jgi:signal transduction histidine kinase
MPVVGAWTWDSDLGFGLTTEMDKAEAYAVLATVRNVTLVLFGAAALGTLCLAILVKALAKRLAASAFREQEVRSSLERQRVRREQAEADLDAAIRAREEFLRNASHELRTPITSLNLLFQHLLRGARDKVALELPADQVERFLRTSERQFSRLNQLVDNLLDVAKETRGHVAMNLEEADLAEIVRQAAERAREQLVAAGSPLDLDLDAPVVGHWDRFRMGHAVINLLSNAARYGLGNPVRVRLRRGPLTACLSVEDKGIGIRESDLDRVFDRFTSVGPLRQVSGLGVGLHIVRAIVEAHRGTIRVESAVGCGSTFIIDLPLPVLDEDMAKERSFSVPHDVADGGSK